jgi:hypothetical protein
MVDDPLAGIWSNESPNFPRHQNYLHFDVTRLRAIAFIVGKIHPVAYMALRTWYRAETPFQIATRLSPNDPWRIHEYRIQGDTCVWVWITGQTEQVWTRVKPGDHPEWLARKLEIANSKMDADERTLVALAKEQ